MVKGVFSPLACQPWLDDALKKMLFLADRDLSKKWTVQVPNLAIVLSHLSVIFKEQLENVL